MRLRTFALAAVLLVLVLAVGIRYLYDPSGQQMVSVSDFEELAPAVAQPGDSPWWRGPNQDGKFGDQNVPTSWGPDENVIWSTEVPGLGHASPCVAGDSIYLFSADEESNEVLLLSYARDTGERRWRTVLHTGGFMSMHEKNTHASATPVCDGKRVYATTILNGQLFVWAVSVDGDLIWEKSAGEFVSTHGYGSSPMLWGSFVIVVGDNTDTAFIAALHRKTGETIWKTRRPTCASFGSPVVATIAGKTQMILAGGQRVTSYDPATGEEIWRCDGVAMTCGNSVAIEGDFVIASGGFPQRDTVCIRGDGSGDVSDTHVVWRTNRGRAYVPSLLAHDGLVFVINDDGVGTCYEVESGKSVWKKRLKGAFSASPILVGSNIFLTNEAGTTHVFAASREFEMISSNPLDERGMATLVACNDQLFIRGRNRLYCVGTTTTGAATTSTDGESAASTSDQPRVRPASR